MKKLFAIILLCLVLDSDSLLSQTIPSYIPTDGLDGWWPFNGNANDESDNDNNGTVNGATLTTDRFGTSNKAYSFDGVNDYIALSEGLLGGNTAAGSATFSAWFLADGSSVSAHWQILGLSAVGAQVLIGNGPQNGTSLYFLHAFTRDLINEDAALVTPGTWQHLAVTFDEGVWAVYVNGAYYAGTNDNSVTTLSFQYTRVYGVDPYVWFGAYRKGNLTPGKVFDGKLDDIAIWNRTLSASEIANLYDEIVITSQPSGTDIVGGKQTSMSIAAEGRSSLAYQWQRNDGSGYANITDGTDYSGTTGATLTIKSAKVSKKGPYRCVVSTTNATVNSNAASLNVTCPCNQ